MLNRRILRSKAMQSLYAYYKSEEANYNLALDFINEKFLPDLNSMEPADNPELSLKRKEVRKIFLNSFKHDSFGKLKDGEQDIEIVAIDAFDAYSNHNKEDFRHFSKTMIHEVEQIFDLYLWLLILPVELADYADNDRREKDLEVPNHFVQNEIVLLLKDNPILNNELKKRKISWVKNRNEVHNWYKNILKKSSDFQDYLKEAKENWQNFDTDRKLILLLYKSILFKNESFQIFMESEDLNWDENKHVLKSMVLKTIKNINVDDSNIELSVLSNNWEDDKAFFNKLFEVTVENGKEFDKLIAEKSQNWDLERIAIMDKIILKMAIAEMIHFPSIPIKVTINEYIELSKNFSTPKSKKFVNGILDVLSEELRDQGVIKKSGRGLIDNK